MACLASLCHQWSCHGQGLCRDDKLPSRPPLVAGTEHYSAPSLGAPGGSLPVREGLPCGGAVLAGEAPGAWGGRAGWREEWEQF